MEVAQAVEPTTKSHSPVEEHDESLVPKTQRGRPALLAKSGITPNKQLVVQAATDAATDIC